MQFRQAKEEDLPRIMEVYNQAVTDCYCTAHLEEVDMAYMENWLKNHLGATATVQVVEVDRKVCGWYSLGPYRPGRQALAHVAEVSYYLHRSCRGRGLGSALMEHALGKASVMGISVLLAILLAKNPASIALLEKHGFERWGSLPGIAHIGEDRVDHLYYGRRL